MCVCVSLHVYVCVFVAFVCLFLCLCVCLCLSLRAVCVCVAGTPEDKMRLFLIYYITAQQVPSEVGRRARERVHVSVCM